MYPSPKSHPSVQCRHHTHRLQQKVSLELDVVHDVALEVARNVDLQVGVVLDEAVHDVKVPGEVVGNLVVPGSGNGGASLEVGHFDEELERLGLFIDRQGGATNTRKRADCNQVVAVLAFRSK